VQFQKIALLKMRCDSARWHAAQIPRTRHDTRKLSMH